MHQSMRWINKDYNLYYNNSNCETISLDHLATLLLLYKKSLDLLSSLSYYYYYYCFNTHLVQRA